MTLIVKGENYASQLMVAGQYSDCSDICTQHDGCGEGPVKIYAQNYLQAPAE